MSRGSEIQRIRNQNYFTFISETKPSRHCIPEEKVVRNEVLDNISKNRSNRRGGHSSEQLSYFFLFIPDRAKRSTFNDSFSRVTFLVPPVFKNDYRAACETNNYHERGNSNDRFSKRKLIIALPGNIARIRRSSLSRGSASTLVQKGELGQQECSARWSNASRTRRECYTRGNGDGGRQQVRQFRNYRLIAVKRIILELRCGTGRKGHPWRVKRRAENCIAYPRGYQRRVRPGRRKFEGVTGLINLFTVLRRKRSTLFRRGPGIAVLIKSIAPPRRRCET